MEEYLKLIEEHGSFDNIILNFSSKESLWGQVKLLSDKNKKLSDENKRLKLILNEN